MASTLCFIHIPKTAGTSLVRSISANVSSPGSVLSAYGREHEIGQMVRELSPEARSALRFVTGHIPWPIGDAIPNRILFSFLRHPVDRMWSDYWFVRTWPKHPLFRAAIEENVTFPAFMTKRSWRFNRNLLVRSFSTPDKEEIEESDLAVALETVRTKLSFVGLCERMGESAEVMNRVIGGGLSLDLWKYASNVASLKPAMPLELRQLAEKENHLDLAFYHEVDRMLGHWPRVDWQAEGGTKISSFPRIDLDAGNLGRVRFNVEEISYNRDTLVIAGWALQEAERKPVAAVYLRSGEDLLAQNIPTYPRSDLFPENACRAGFMIEAHCASVFAAKQPLYLGFLLADRSGVVEKLIEP